MTCRRLSLSLALALAAVFGAGPAAAAPHEHGVARLAVAIEGGNLSIVLDAPLDGFLGFERAPRTEAERKAGAALLAQLRDGHPWFKLDAEAACRAGPVRVDVPVLEGGAKAGSEHADLEAEFLFACDKPQALRTLELGLFDAFKRLQRIEVQVAGPRGQMSQTLKRPAKRVQLQR